MRALLTEGFLRINKFDLLFFIVLIFAAYIRIYNSIEFNPFSGEIGDNLLDIKNYYLNKEIPLIGPPTSHPWLYFGPLFYWIYGPILILSGFNPATHAYFGSIVSVLVVIFNYKFTSQLVNKKIGFLSTFIIAFSPFYIGWGQTGRFFTLVLLLIYPYLYFVIKHLKKEKHNLFLAGLFMGLMLNFHFTPLLLVPPTLIISYIYKKAGIIKNSLLYFGGIIIANLPLLIYDALHNFDMLVKFILWIPYRVAGFIGLYPKNNPTQDTFLSNLISFYNYSAETLTAVYPDQKILFFIIFSVSVAYVTYSLIKDTKTNKYVQIILLFLLFGYVGIFIHGNPPEHYYLPIAFIPSVITSLFIKSIRSRYLTLLFLTIVILSGLKSVNYHLNKYSTSSYKIKLEITKKIIDDVGSNPYILKRVGENDEFEGDFAQDYQYLLWWFGNEPIQVGEQKLSDQEPVYVYTIHENTTQLEDSFYHQNDISVIRKKL